MCGLGWLPVVQIFVAALRCQSEDVQSSQESETSMSIGTGSFSAPYNDSAWRGFSINADWSASPETTELTKRKFKQINENARQVLSMSECQYLFI